MRAQLLPLDGSPPIDITKDLIVVGRKEECDLRLDHKSVSKMHCILVKTDGLLLLRDLGSTNGTRVNGTRVRRAALLPNDQLTIANYKFRVHLGPDEPARPARPSHDHTQRIDALDASILRKAREKGTAGDDEEPSIRPAAGRPMQRNQLPDVYTEDSPQSLSG
jgi:pSer/pThr/pTyr-binding forkhead associated (FHA) protein